MKYVAYILCLLMLTVSGCLAVKTSNSGGVAPKSVKMSDLKIEKQQYENQKKEFEKQLGLAKKELCGSAVASSGGSFPGGMSHIDYRQDPTNVSTWRDPLSKGDAVDNFIKTKGEIEWIEDTLKETEKALTKVDKEIQELERSESGGSEGGGGGGGSGGGGC